MKNLIAFIYDTILIISFLTIVSAAFVAGFALSPISYNESYLAKNNQSVLGEKDVALKFNEIFNNTSDMSIKSSISEEMYSAVINNGPVDNGTHETEIVEISNLSSLPRKVRVTLKSGLSYSRNMNISAVYSSSNIIKTNEQKDFTIKSNSSVKVAIRIESSYKINFPIESEIIIEQIN